MLIDKQETIQTVSTVYCDNDRLEECILDAKPSTYGLYTHEILMIFYADISSLKTVNTEFSSIFKYQLHVEYPSLLLKSLIERGFIQICTIRELVYHLKYKELIQLLQAKMLHNKGQTKNSAQKIVRANYTDAEIFDFFNYAYYVPTEKGKEVLEANPELTNSPYDAWNQNCAHKNGEAVKSNIIQLTEQIAQTRKIHIKKKESTFYFSDCPQIQEKITGWGRDFPEDTRVTIFVDDKILCSNFSVDKIYFMETIKKIVLCKRTISETYTCTCYDFMNEIKEFEESGVPHLSSDSPNDHFDALRRLHSSKGIYTDDTINYFVSINNILAYYILQNSLGKRITIRKIKNYLIDDKSMNYEISVKVSDSYARNIIMYLLVNNLLQGPVIKGVELYTVMEFLRKTGSSKVQQLLMDNNMQRKPYELGVVNEVKERFPYSWEKIFTIFTRVYPKRLFYFDWIATYSSLEQTTDQHSTNLPKDENWVEVKVNSIRWKNEFNALLEELMVNDTIQPRWKSEFSLYLIVKNYFPDAVFQYHTQWLGRQSLDIYIPTIRTGIEYQGQQHYEIVDFFTNAESFEQRKDLDERKRKLCLENEVKLIEWPYTLDVTVLNFSQLMSKHGIECPSVSNRSRITNNQSL